MRNKFVETLHTGCLADLGVIKVVYAVVEVAYEEDKIVFKDSFAPLPVDIEERLFADGAVVLVTLLYVLLVRREVAIDDADSAIEDGNAERNPAFVPCDALEPSFDLTAKDFTVRWNQRLNEDDCE
jgi:hypothetical protein